MAASQPSSPLDCPFCNFKDVDPGFLFQHVNLIHPENENAPYLLDDGNRLAQAGRLESAEIPSTSTEGAFEWVKCSCGDYCLLTEYSNHLDLHEAENLDDLEFITAGVHDTSLASSSLVDSTDQGSKPSSLSAMLSHEHTHHDNLRSSRPPTNNISCSDENAYSGEKAMRLSDQKPGSKTQSARLGVSLLCSAIVPANLRLRKQSLAHIITKEGCPMQCENCWKRVER